MIELVENGFKCMEYILGLFIDIRLLFLEIFGKVYIKMGNFWEVVVVLKRVIFCRCKGVLNDNFILNLVCLYVESFFVLLEYEKVV